MEDFRRVCGPLRALRLATHAPVLHTTVVVAPGSGSARSLTAFGDVGRACATRSSTASCAQLLRWWDARVWLRRCGRGSRLLFEVCASCSLPSMTPPVWAARVGVQIRRCGQGCAFALRGVPPLQFGLLSVGPPGPFVGASVSAPRCQASGGCINKWQV